MKFWKTFPRGPTVAPIGSAAGHYGRISYQFLCSMLKKTVVESQCKMQQHLELKHNFGKGQKEEGDFFFSISKKGSCEWGKWTHKQKYSSPAAISMETVFVQPQFFRYSAAAAAAAAWMDSHKTLQHSTFESVCLLFGSYLQPCLFFSKKYHCGVDWVVTFDKAHKIHSLLDPFIICIAILLLRGYIKYKSDYRIPKYLFLFKQQYSLHAGAHTGG